MSRVLKSLTPVAKKEHRCDFCGCIIPAGTKYQKDTIASEGMVYDWLSHQECMKVADLLDMFEGSRDDGGVDQDAFKIYVNDYLEEYYSDPITHKVRDDVKVLTCIGKVKLILEDYDKPEFRIMRLEQTVRHLEFQERCHYITDGNRKILEKARARLEELKKG